MPGTAVGDATDAGRRAHQAKDRDDQQWHALQVGVGQVGDAGEHCAHVRRPQRERHPLLVVDGEPVGRAEHLVDVLQPGRQAGRRIVREQRVAANVDVRRVPLCVGAELVAPVEHLDVPERHLAGARLLLVAGEPRRLERLQAHSRRTVRTVARTDDVVDEVALVLGQRQATGGGARRIARHHVVVVETDHLAGAAELVGVLAVPQRQQHVAMRAQEHAELRVLAIAIRAGFGNRGGRVARSDRQFIDFGRGVAERLESGA